MTADLKTIETNSSASNKLCIDVLEEALQLAKEGRVLSVGIAAVVTEGELFMDFAGGTGAAALGSSLLILQSRYIEWMREE